MSGPPTNAITALQAWYARQCDGEWEHGYGIRLQTLDNPGWTITVSLHGTPMEHEDMTARLLNYQHDTDWIIIQKEGASLKGACGALQLEAMLSLVCEWLHSRD